MKRLVFCLVVLFAISGIFGPAKAALVSVSGPASSMGTAPAIIAPPFHVLDNIVTNTGMQGFDEAQEVVTTVAHTTDSGVIPAGALVDSHMIFLNSEGSAFLPHFGDFCINPRKGALRSQTVEFSCIDLDLSQ